MITGATGATGKNAIANLIEMDIPVRALVHRKDGRSDLLASQGAEIVEGELSDFKSVSAALEGITSAYFVYPIQVPGIIEATAYFAQAAAEQHVVHIVNMSQRSARRGSPSHAAQNHWVAERVFDHFSVPVTHLRPTLFAEWLSYFAEDIKHNNRLVSPFTNAQYAPIAGEDIGRVIASVLARPQEYSGKTLELYGNQEVTQNRIAELLSESLGRSITYMPVDIEHFKKVLEGYPPYFIQHVTGIVQEFNTGNFAGMNSHVEEITGRRPLTVGSYIQKNIGLFK
ncbi:MAG: NmrA family NAD(P)-binding protein [Dyadobacter sp.]|uniref:NmrA family NAD(P)-binding protein n=1 Tax=Dyadobacter sp. TaxID=1914288 RepID=UPI0032647B35